MAFVWQIKRRLAGDPGPPAVIDPGELAFNEVDNTLYIGAEIRELSGTTTDTLSTSAIQIL
jgi:hypothetical protein